MYFTDYMKQELRPSNSNEGKKSYFDPDFDTRKRTSTRLKLFSFAFVFILILSGLYLSTYGSDESEAAGGSCGDGLTWTLSDGVLEITYSGTGTGRMNDSYMQSLFYSYSDSIVNVVIGDGVTYIGEYAFYKCIYMETVDIPNTVTEIGQYAFSICSSLESVYIWGDSVEIRYAAFQSCESLYYLDLGSGVTSIESYAFNNCPCLSSVNIPASTTYLGPSAFLNCIGITEVSLSSGLEMIGQDAFFGCKGITSVYLQNGIKYIGGFNGCTGITSIVLPDSVKTIADNCFKSCTSLLSIKIGSSVSSIGNSAFEGCTSLRDFNFNEGLETIGDSAFERCTSITTITIPDSVVSIADDAFKDCSKITTIKIKDGVKTIGQKAFSQCLSITNIDFGLSITSVGTGAFEGLTFQDKDGNVFDPAVKKRDKAPYVRGAKFIQISEKVLKEVPEAEGFCGSGLSYSFNGERVTIKYLGYGTGMMYDYSASEEGLPWAGCTKVVISNGVTSIGARAFYNCKISEISLPDSVISIEDGAFRYCKELKTVELPSKLEHIGAEAFMHCESLINPVLPSSLITIDDNAFLSCSSITSMNLPNKVSKISAGVFSYTGLTSFTIPETVREIRLHCFEGCEIETIFVPKSVVVLEPMFRGPDWFYENNWPKSITVSEDNKSYTSIDGVVFTKDKKELIEYPCGKSGTSYVIPSGTSKIGNYAFNGCRLKSVTIPNSINQLGEWAFLQCMIESLTIPEGIKEIPEGFAFKCYGLKEVSLPSSLITIAADAFCLTTSLESITLPEGTVSIGDSAFSSSAIKEVTLPSSIHEISNRAFGSCKINKVTLPQGMTYFNILAFRDSVVKDITISESVSEISSTGIPVKEDWFKTIHNYSLLDFSVYFNADVIEGTLTEATVGDYTILCNDLSKKCKVIKYAGKESSLSIPSIFEVGSEQFETISIAKDAFLTIQKTSIGDKKIKNETVRSIVVPEGVLSLERGSLEGCSVLESVTLPDSLSYIGSAALGENPLTINKIPKNMQYWKSSINSGSKILSFEIPDNMEGLHNIILDSMSGFSVPSSNLYHSANGGVLFNKDQTKLIRYHPQLSSDTYTIPESVTNISSGAFSGCVNLKHIVLPEGLESMYGILRDSSIEEITIPASFKKIEDNAFKGVKSLKTVIIPESVTIIGEYAFCNCSSLEKVIIGSNTARIETGAFLCCTSLKQINIPDRCWIIDREAFSGSIIENMEISKHNDMFSWKDGAFYSKDMTDLICYCSDDWYNFKVPDTVLSIRPEAFYNAPYVDIPIGVEDVHPRALGSFTVYYNGVKTDTEDIDLAGKVWVCDGLGCYFSNLDGGFRIDFDACGGTTTSKIMSTVNGKLISFPKAIKEGYVFDGWYTQKEGGEKMTTFTSNTTLYAHWKIMPKSIAITCDESEINPHKEYQMIAIVDPQECIEQWDIKWTVDNRNLANVSSDGMLSTLRTGVVTVKASIVGTDLVSEYVVEITEEKDETNLTLYIIAGVVVLVVIAGIFFLRRR